MENNKTAECGHCSIMYINSGIGWLCMDCRAFSIDKEKFDFVSAPLSKVGEVTDEQIEKEADLWDEHNGDELGYGHVGFVDGMKHYRSLLQPQPVNSEGKKEEAKLRLFLATVANKDWIEMLEDGWLNEQYAMNNPKGLTSPKWMYEMIEKGCATTWPTVEQGEAKEPTEKKILEAFKSLTLYSSSDEEKCSVMRLLFRSSEVKEQEDIKIYDWFCAKCGVYAMDEQNSKKQITDEMIKVEGRKRATHHITGYFDQTKCDWFCRGGEFVRSLQVKSNEQTKKDG